MTTVVLDLEGTNLLPFCDKIWCVSILDTSSGIATTYHTKASLLAASDDWTVLVGHNVCAYDLYVLWLIWGIPFTIGPDTFNGKPIKIVDTLVLSRYLWPDRPWGHSLESWGEHLGHPKGAHNDWTQYSEAMAEYNRQDCRVTAEVYKALEKDIGLQKEMMQ